MKLHYKINIFPNMKLFFATFLVIFALGNARNSDRRRLDMPAVLCGPAAAATQELIDMAVYCAARINRQGMKGHKGKKPWKISISKKKVLAGTISTVLMSKLGCPAKGRLTAKAAALGNALKHENQFIGGKAIEFAQWTGSEVVEVECGAVSPVFDTACGFAKTELVKKVKLYGIPMECIDKNYTKACVSACKESCKK